MMRAQVYLPTGTNVDFDAMEVTRVSNRKSSFEPAYSLGAPNWQKFDPPGGVTNWARYGGSAKSGGVYLRTNRTSAQGSEASVYQDISLTISPGDSYVFSAWMRSPTSAPIAGTQA
jgi:hypothetical protein